ncbi:MAG: ATP-binding protein [Candidatus Binatia bacterium]
MKQRLRNRLTVKLFLTNLVVILFLLAFFYLYSTAVMRSGYISVISQELAHELQEESIVNRLLHAKTQGNSLDKICRKLGNKINARITVIALDGRVMGDSNHPSETMENHRTRPEVVQALAKGTGRSIRYSTTVHYEMLYQALLIREGNGGRVLRFSVPLKAIEEVTASMRRPIFEGLLIASGLGLLLAFLLSRHLGKRIKRMAAFSQRVAQGAFPQGPLRIRGHDELGILETNLSEMSQSIQQKVKETVAEKEKAESILRCMIEGVLVIDTQGKVILLNQNAEKMFKLPVKPARGISPMEISRHPEMKQLMEEVFACDDATQTFTKVIALDDDRFFLVNTVNLRDGANQLLGHILVFHDITELRRLENIRTEFVANVSHELRTPITAIRGYAETLLHTPPTNTADKEQFIGIIHRHSERVGRLVDDLLTLSDLESGKVQLVKEKLEVNHLIEGVLEIFQTQAREKQITLSHLGTPDLPAVMGDVDRLQQLLINLIDNAIKYTSLGGLVTIKANTSCNQDTENTPMIEIAVEDNGCGIPEKALPRLTERFYRVDRARSREMGGTGLGLAIVKHIVYAHQGLLKIESQPAIGTTVRVLLPAEKGNKNWKGILFICAANSCRSQMAEGFGHHFAPEGIRVYSAGTDPRQIHPLAMKVMHELGMDISDQRSKGLEAIPMEQVDLVVTLCGDPEEVCPVLPQKIAKQHWPLPDPALTQGDEETVLESFRHVRDELRTRVKELFCA